MWRKIVKRILLGMFLIPILGFGYEQVSRRMVSARYPVQGKLVDLGNGRKLQLDCRGQERPGYPTVVLESGFDTFGSMDWTKVQDAIAETTRVCSYSRAGIMWSDDDSRDFSAHNAATDLNLLLEKAKITGPIVLVAHSIGGPIAMKYVELFPEKVKGVVFVDTSHPDEISKAEAINKQFKINSDPSGEMPLWLVSVAAELGCIRLFGVDGEAKTILPYREAQIAKAFFPQTVYGVAKQSAFANRIVAESTGFRALGDRPMINLVSDQPVTPTEQELLGMGMTAESFARFWSMNTALKRELNAEREKWSTNSKSVFVSDSGHFIHLDSPEIVVKSIKEVVESVANNNASIR